MRSNSLGGTPVMRSTSPAISAAMRLEVSGMTRNTTVSNAGAPPQ